MVLETGTDTIKVTDKDSVQEFCSRMWGPIKDYNGCFGRKKTDVGLPLAEQSDGSITYLDNSLSNADFDTLSFHESLHNITSLGYNAVVKDHKRRNTRKENEQKANEIFLRALSGIAECNKEVDDYPVFERQPDGKRYPFLQSNIRPKIDSILEDYIRERESMDEY